MALRLRRPPCPLISGLSQKQLLEKKLVVIHPCLNEMLAVFRLGSVKKWKQTRRQIAFRILDIDKLDGGSAMTDICNSAQKTNRLIGHTVNRIIYSLCCHNHLRNALDEIAEKPGVPPSFISFARAIDKEFSLCANYLKGYGAIFQAGMKDNHSGELLLHVERTASGGRQDVASMAALAIYWNRNFYVEFLDDMKTYPDKDDNILVNNLHTMLTSVEMVSVARLWAILHISIVMPMRYLAANTHKWASLNWGPISLGRVLDSLKEDLESIMDQPELVHDEAFMMGMMSPWAELIPDFKLYLEHQFEGAKQRKVAESDSWAVPLKEVRRELFHPRDQDNKDSTEMLEILAKIACQAWIDELLDPKEAAFQYLSESKSEYSYEYCPEEMKEALLGAMAVNDLAESSFAGVTAQVQFFGRIGLAGVAAVSDMARNSFLSRAKPGTDDGNTGLFHKMPEELQLTAVMCAIEYAPETRESNSNALDLQHKAKQARQELVKKAGLENASDEYTECLIHHKLWDAEHCWKTSNEVKKGPKRIEFKKDKELAGPEG
ncbi:hypothetical protein ACHAXR_007880 [Thalassiosira sp. AJA248-18]